MLSNIPGIERIAFVIQTEMKTVIYDLVIKKITFYLFMSDFVSNFSEKNDLF